jgi:hypothetical protein
MVTTLFISENKLKAFSDLNQSVDADLLKNAIREAQDIHIQQYLGYNLYQKLIQDVNAGSLSGDYLFLMTTYIQDTLLYWSYYEALEAIWLRPRNNGLLIPQGGQEGAPADMRIYDKKRTSVRNKAEWYAERLVGYLIDNETKFPEFGTETGMEIYPDQRSAFNSPFVTKRGYYEDMKKLGIKVTDSRYKYLPQ